MAIRVLAVGNANTTQTDHRSLITALTAPAGPSTHRGGVFPTNSPAGLVNVSAMVVGVSAFKAIVPNTSGSGYYLVQSDSQINLTFDSGEAGVTRTDRIIARVYNDSLDASGLNEATVEYLKGQTSGSATALPDSSLLLWEIPVPAGASSGTGGINFTGIGVNKRVFTTASGGIIPVADTTEMDGITNPYDGMAVWHKTLDVILVHDGTSFKVKGIPSVTSSGSLSTIPNPYEGLLAFTRDTDSLYRYTGSSWTRGIDEVATAQPTEVYTDANDTSTSTSYTPGTSNGTSFVAPPSGKVYITYSGWLGNNSTTNSVTAYLSNEVRSGGTVGSGTVFQAASDSRAAINTPNDTPGYTYSYVTLEYLLTGLTAGSTYNVRTVFRAVSGEAAVNRRRILVKPVL